MDTIPKELVSLIQSASKPAAPAAQTAQAPSASAKASTDLLQGLVDAKKGKPDETLKSKLTDTDTLIRFAAGLGAILSGEAGMGAALVGAGFANAGQEAADDNKKRDEEADALTLKLAQSAADRENKVFQMGLTNQEYIKEVGPAFDKLAGVDGSGMFEGISNSLTNKENMRIANEYAQAAANLPSGSQQRIDMISQSLKLARIPDPTGDYARGLATDKPDYELARRVGADMDPASFDAAWEQLIVDGDFPKYYRALRAPDGRMSMSSGYSDYLQWQQLGSVLAKADALYRDNPDLYADALDALKRAPEITSAERATYMMSAKDIPENSFKNEYAVRFDLEYYTGQQSYWREKLTEQNLMASTSNDPDIRKLFLDPAALEAKASELASKSTAVYLENRYGTSLLRTEAMRARLDPDGSRAAELPGRIAQAKASLLSEGYDPNDPMFEEATANRTYEMMNGIPVTAPAIKKIGKTEPTSQPDEAEVEITAADLGEGAALLPGMQEAQAKRVSKVNAKRKSAERLALAKEKRESQTAAREKRLKDRREYLFDQGGWVAKNITNDMDPAMVEALIKSRIKEVGLATVNPVSAVFFKPGSEFVDEFVNKQYAKALEKVIPGDTIQQTATSILEYLEGDLSTRND